MPAEDDLALLDATKWSLMRESATNQPYARLSFTKQEYASGRLQEVRKWMR